MTTPDSSTSKDARPVSRRAFLGGAAAAGAAAAGGFEGILAARRAPAYAQGTRLNIVRWVDFIPACDVELKRQRTQQFLRHAQALFEEDRKTTASVLGGAAVDVSDKEGH